MVSFYCSSGNSEQFKKVWDRDTHIHSHTHTLTHTTHTHTHACAHIHTHAYQLLGQKPGVYWPSKPAWLKNASIHKKYDQNY